MTPTCSYCGSKAHFRSSCPYAASREALKALDRPMLLDDIKPKTLMVEGAMLMSESGENKEYDRAIVELVCTLLGISTDERATVETMLRGLK